MGKKSLCLIWGIVLVLVFKVSFAAESTYSYGLTPYAGYHFFDDERDYKDRPEVGIRLEKFLSEAWSIEAGVGYVPTKRVSTDQNKSDITYSLNGTYNFLLRNSKFVPYLTAGLGGDYIEGNSKNGLNAGIGARWFLTETMALRPEVRYINLLEGREDWLISVGLNFLFGKAPAPSVAAAAPAPAPAPEPVPAPAPAPTPKPAPAPAPAPVPVPEKVVETITLHVYFDTAKSVVKKEYYPEIEKFAAYLNRYPDVKAEIQGHTDNVGNPKKNVTLSQRRANAIVDILIKKYNINPARLSAKGYGQEKPIAPNTTSEGREKNRRVDAVISK